MATMTAARRRQQAKIEYDAFLADCPSRQVLNGVSDKRVSLVLCGLADGPKRYSELSRLIAGVSQKMLTQTLRSLERDGLVLRTVTASAPARVDCELTSLGTSLRECLRALVTRAEEHSPEVLAARNSYDDTPSAPAPPLPPPVETTSVAPSVAP